MASKKPPYFSDKELLAELKKLGYNDVTPDVFNMMKNDLSVMVKRDNISSRKFKNVSSVRYTSTQKQLTSATDDIPNLNENGSLLHSNDSIKKDLYDKYKNRFNSLGLNIETRSPVDQQSSQIYQGTSVDYKKSIINNITGDKDGKITGIPFHSIQAVKVFPKSQKKDNFAGNVSQVVSISPENNFVNNKPHISESTSPTIKVCLKKENPLNLDGKIRDKKDMNKPYGLNPISESNSTSVPKTYRNKDSSMKIDFEQSFGKSDKNKSGELKSKSVNQSNCENGLFSKKDDLKTNSKIHQIALMTSKTKATVECHSLNLTAKSQSRSSLKHQTSTENANNGVKHQDNSENEKPEGDNSVISSSKSVSRNYGKSLKKYDQNSEKNGSDVKSSLKIRKTVVLNDSLTSSGSTVMTKKNDQQVNKHKESSLKSSKNVENSDSVLSVSNRQDSPKLPSIEQSRASKIHGQNVSTTSSLNSSDEIENHDTKSSSFSLDSSHEAESHEEKFGSSPSFDSSSPEVDNSFPKYRFSTSNLHQLGNPGQNRFSGVSSFDSSLEPEDPLEKYRRRFKLNAFSSQEDLLGASSVKIKRKVLRHRNGESIVTEELLNVPSIFTSSYPSTELGLESSKSFSSDDLSFRTSVVPEVLRSSYSTPRSIHVRIANQRKKKTDPVAMYNYYKKFWNNFKPPGEKSHDKLRWAVRDRMLDYKM